MKRLLGIALLVLVHSVMRNPSSTEPARFVAFMIKKADAPAVVPVTAN